MRSFTRLTLGVSSTPSPICRWLNHPTSGSSIKPRHTQPRCLHATRPVRPPSDTPSLQPSCDDETAISLASLLSGVLVAVSMPLGDSGPEHLPERRCCFRSVQIAGKTSGFWGCCSEFLGSGPHCVDVFPHRAWLRRCSSVFAVLHAFAAQFQRAHGLGESGHIHSLKWRGSSCHSAAFRATLGIGQAGPLLPIARLGACRCSP